MCLQDYKLHTKNMKFFNPNLKSWTCGNIYFNIGHLQHQEGNNLKNKPRLLIRSSLIRPTCISPRTRMFITITSSPNSLVASWFAPCISEQSGSKITSILSFHDPSISPSSDLIWSPCVLFLKVCEEYCNWVVVAVAYGDLDATAIKRFENSKKGVTKCIATVT